MDYINRVPPYDSQYSALTHTDVQDCTVESLAHNFYIMTGIRVSPRAWAVACGLKDPANRNIEHVLKVVNQVGYVLWDDCPTPASFTMDSYYTPLTAAEAKWHPVEIDLVPFDLNVSPGWTEIEWGYDSPGVFGTRHMVSQINNTQYFDSEIGAPIKPLNYEGAHIVYQTSLSIKKGVDMLVFFQVKGISTLWKLMDSQWVGFSDMTAFNNYVGGRPNVVIELDQVEFDKLHANPDVFKN